mmetsp:Transcript_8548/g.27242  ORF Transcript_8548/g.27242 Transcript_8548/m.27242 type:complete len:227 (-) Transcript_8548:176-856(-)
MEFARLIHAAEEFARVEMAGNDGSHDFEHVERVRRLALRLAREVPEDLSSDEDFATVELGALLHDVQDHKYAGENADPSSSVATLLREHGASEELIDRVVYVVVNVSWSKQMKRSEPLRMTPELAVVQDADRLDSIGAIGIARCFAFGGSRGRGLYSLDATAPTPEIRRDGDKSDETSIGHFFDKLFKIKNYMNTDGGKREAEVRHQYLESFVAQLASEVETVSSA